jgi:hypothetical protein
MATGWGGRIRTCDPGTKTRCLATWPRPSIALRQPRDYTGAGLSRQVCTTASNGLEHLHPAGHGPVDADEWHIDLLFCDLGALLSAEDAVDGRSGPAHGSTQRSQPQ